MLSLKISLEHEAKKFQPREVCLWYNYACFNSVINSLLHFLKLQGKMWTIMCSPVTLAFHEEEIKMKGCEIVWGGECVYSPNGASSDLGWWQWGGKNWAWGAGFFRGQISGTLSNLKGWRSLWSFIHCVRAKDQWEACVQLYLSFTLQTETHHSDVQWKSKGSLAFRHPQGSGRFGSLPTTTILWFWEIFAMKAQEVANTIPVFRDPWDFSQWTPCGTMRAYMSLLSGWLMCGLLLN